MNERLDSLLFDIQDVMAAKGSSRVENVDIDLDEAYVSRLFSPPLFPFEFLFNIGY